MPGTDVLLLLLSIATAIVLVLLVVLLLRRPDAALERLRMRVEEALRDEQRAGRGELRQQLDSLALAQGQRIEDFGRHHGVPIGCLSSIVTKAGARVHLSRSMALWLEIVFALLISTWMVTGRGARN